MDFRSMPRAPSQTPPLYPEKLEAALLLVKGGMSPTKAARRTALGRSTLYREIQARDHA